MDSNRLLDAVCRKHRINSNRALARYLNVDRSRITAYRNGRRKLDPDACLAVADALALPRGYVLAVVQAERAKRTAHRREWLNIAKQIKAAGMATTVALGTSAMLAMPEVQAELLRGVCILRKIEGADRRGRRRDRRRVPRTPDRHTLPLIA